MNLTDLIGTLAALLTTLSFVPQAWHTFQTKDVSGISLGMYSAFTLGVALWLAYSLLSGAAFSPRLPPELLWATDVRAGGVG